MSEGARVVAVDDGKIPGNTPEEKAATWRYWQEFNLDRYYSQVENLTFRTTFIDISPQRAEALSKVLRGAALSTQQEKEEIQTLTSQLDEAIGKYGKAFAKLSSRSPKDAVDKIPHKLIPIIRQQLAKYPQTQAGEFVAFRQALMEGMAVASAQEVFELFSFSSRIVADLIRALDNRDSWDLKIVLREFVPIPLQGELRGFVHKGVLTGLSQYYTLCYFPWLVEHRDWAKQQVEQFYQVLAQQCPHSTFVMDLVVFPEGSAPNHIGHSNVVLVELNPWTTHSGAALYSWSQDLEILENGPLELRIETKEQDIRFDRSWLSLIEEAKKPTTLGPKHATADRSDAKSCIVC